MEQQKEINEGVRVVEGTDHLWTTRVKYREQCRP